VDDSFNPGKGANGTIFAVGLQSDGKIIVAGEFTRFDGEVRGRYARLLSDGTLDDNFDPGTGANNTVYTLAVGADNNIVIGGDFTVVNRVPRNGVARIRGNDQDTDIPILSATYQAGHFHVVVGASPGSTYVLEATGDLVNWTQVDSETASGNSVELIDTGAGALNKRFYRVRKD
jgi:hypothetical protein